MIFLRWRFTSSHNRRQRKVNQFADTFEPFSKSHSQKSFFHFSNPFKKNLPPLAEGWGGQVVVVVVPRTQTQKSFQKSLQDGFFLEGFLRFLGIDGCGYVVISTTVYTGATPESTGDATAFCCVGFCLFSDCRPCGGVFSKTLYPAYRGGNS